MESVSLNQLKTVCNLYLEVEFPYFEELREAFFVLDICGCRIEELFQIERWAWVSGNIVTLQPQKNNLPRTITLNENTQNFLNCIKTQTKPFLGRTSFQLQYLFRKLNPYIPIYSGGREISLYCYRYKHIWQAQADGQTVEQIRIEMGHRTQTPILLYLAADINSTYYIEPTIEDPIPLNHIDLITTIKNFNGSNSAYYHLNSPEFFHLSVAFRISVINDYSRLLLSNPYSSGGKLAPYISCRKYPSYIYFSIGISIAAYSVWGTNPVYVYSSLPINMVITYTLNAPSFPPPSVFSYTIRVYVNGTLIVTFSPGNSSLYKNWSDILPIGGQGIYPNSLSSQFQGSLTYLYMWPRILSIDEILQLNSLSF